MNTLPIYLPRSAVDPGALRLVWVLLGAGMALRLIWAILVPVEPVSDPHAYDIFARTLVEHGVYGWTAQEPSAYWPVGTSAVTALLYFVFGQNYVSVVAMNLLVGFASMILTFRLAEAFFGTRPALWTLGAMAFWPNLIMFTSILSSELYFILLTLAGLWFWHRHQQRDSLWILLVLCALCWGAAAYFRPIILLVPITLVLAALPQGTSVLARNILRAAIVTVLMVAVVLPWSYRNYQVFGEFVLVSTNFGPNLWMGNNPETTGGYMELPEWVGELSEVERSETLGIIAIEYIRDDPVGFILRTAQKLVLLHERETIGVVWNEAAIERIGGTVAAAGLKVLASGFWYLLILAAAVGIVRIGRNNPFLAVFNPPFAIWAYFALLHAVIVAMDRYHMPSSPFIVMLAGVGLAWIATRYRRPAADPARGAP